jgi:hypothetical protein
MASQDDLAQLEAERDRLLSMIAYHDGPFYRAPGWFSVIETIVCGITTTGRPAGERETRQRLAECEARIMKLKEGRS